MQDTRSSRAEIESWPAIMNDDIESSSMSPTHSETWTPDILMLVTLQAYVDGGRLAGGGDIGTVIQSDPF